MKTIKIILNSILLSLICVVIWKNTMTAGQNHHASLNGIKSWLTGGAISMFLIVLVILGLVALMIHFLPAGEHDAEE